MNLGQVLGVATTTVELPRICDPYIRTFIKFGSRNNVAEDVQRLQMFFNQFEGASLDVTGVYNQPTLEAASNTPTINP